MSTEWNRQALLEPISAESPCGESLEDSPLLFSLEGLRLFGQLRSPEAPPDPDEDEKEKGKAKPPPDWGQIKGNALEALAKSKDLRALAHAAVAMLRTNGLLAYFDALTVASSWLDAYWPYVYPLIDEDAMFRRNALNCFADLAAVLDRLSRAPLVDSRKHGRFGLRDFELATGQMAPGAADAKPDPEAINAAFQEMPLDDLAGLERGASAAIDAVKAIDSRMRAEGGAEMTPDFDGLSSLLARMQRMLKAQLSVRIPAAGADGVEAEASGGTIAVGAVRSRQDAIRALEAVAEFFRRNEPSSPIPMFLDRAKRLVAKDFLEVLADIAPDALTVARAAGGVRDE